jgi:hypothetical protein
VVKIVIGGYPSSATYPPDELYNVKAQSNASTGLNCSTGALTQGRMSVDITLDGGTNTPAGNDAIIKYYIQYRASAGTASWTSATAVNDGVLETVTSGLTVTAAANASVIKNYQFAIAGEYRVVTENLTGTACGFPVANPFFTVNFGDASYPAYVCGALNPCT